LPTQRIIAIPDPSGPSYHQVLMAKSSDGLAWQTDGKVIIDQASVPGGVRLPDGRLIIYAVDGSGLGGQGLVYAESNDEGKSWTCGKVNIQGADPDVVLLPDGKIRVYYVEFPFGPGQPPADPAKTDKPNQIKSAISSDGKNFTVEEGVRLEGIAYTDPDVIRVGNEWFMYVSTGTTAWAARSDDGLAFKLIGKVNETGAVSGSYIFPDGTIRHYFCGKGGIASAISAYGASVWKEEAGVRLPFNPSFKSLCDPSVISDGKGGYLMFYKIQPSSERPGSPPPGGQPTQPPPGGSLQPGNQIKVEPVKSAYKTTQAKRSGWFVTGQKADLMLSGIDFNKTGGPLLFNHPGGIASDGTRLLLADRNNNRVLIWKQLPTGNVAPDLVLGQKDFDSNNPGTGLDQLNWPTGVSAGGNKLVVADSYNNRILIWTGFPTKNGQSADLVIQNREGDPRLNIVWPWGVWTDGEKLAVSATGSRMVLLWNTFPSRNEQPADIVLRGDLGTPRHITSNGHNLIVGDHNAFGRPGQQSKTGNFFWKTWPTKDDQPPDFFMSLMPPDDVWHRIGSIEGTWLKGEFTDDGKLIMLADHLFVWNSFPQNESDEPDIVVGTSPGFSFRGGDGGGVTIAGGKIYVGSYNGNKIVGYKSIPQSRDAKPDLAIGSSDVEANTLETNFFITNPVPATDGQSLFVSSDFDRKLYVWKALPDESGAHPDFVYSLPDGPWDNALWGETLVLAGRKTVYLWSKLPRNGELPAVTFQDRIGSVRFQEIKGVALDGQYFYLADRQANKVYIWKGIPTENPEPAFTLSVDKPTRLFSDGKYLAVTATEAGPEEKIIIFRVDRLSAGGDAVRVRGNFNLPEGVLIAQGHLLVADTSFNRVQVWTKIEDAMAGKMPDVILGATDLNDTTPEIGQDKLFWPAALAFDGGYLWVAEFKFSGRLLRFSVRE
jgi:hypothetical protein